MPAITSGKVLVSGANGYIAVWVVKTLLEKGFSVRGTIRSADKEVFLKKIFASYGDKLELIVVKDITQDGAFDEAVKGVDAIEHMAAPFHLGGKHPDDLIVPTVAGTRSILQSALKFGTAVKRVVVTSSFAALEEPDDLERVYTEENWNRESLDKVEKNGADTLPSDIYRASKTLGEREAWNFVDAHKSEISWDLVTLNPPFVYGPVLQDIASVAALNMSMAIWYHYVLQGNADKEALATDGGFWVDVRDAAAAHVKSITVEQAGGHRILLAAGFYRWQDWLNASRVFNPALPAGNTSYDLAKDVRLVHINSNKFENLLGLKYHTMEETSKVILDNFQERGLWDGQVAQ